MRFLIRFAVRKDDDSYLERTVSTGSAIGTRGTSPNSRRHYSCHWLYSNTTVVLIASTHDWKKIVYDSVYVNAYDLPYGKALLLFSTIINRIRIIHVHGNSPIGVKGRIYGNNYQSRLIHTVDLNTQVVNGMFQMFYQYRSIYTLSPPPPVVQSILVEFIPSLRSHAPPIPPPPR